MRDLCIIKLDDGNYAISSGEVDGIVLAITSTIEEANKWVSAHKEEL